MLRHILHKGSKHIKWISPTILHETNGRRRYKYLIWRKDKSYFVKNPLWFCQIVLYSWYQQHARDFDWQHICYVWWTCCSTDSRYTYVHKLRSCSRRLVPLFAWVRPHKGASQENEKKLTRSFNFTFRSVDDVFWLHNSNDFVDRTYPIELEIRIPQIQLGLYYTLTKSRYWLRTGWERNITTKKDDFNFSIVNFPFNCSNIPAVPAYIWSIYLSWSDIPEIVVPIRISVIEGCC